MSGAQKSPPPRLLVFDLDACLWTPEMFELDGRPSRFDAEKGGVRAGSDIVRLFPGAMTVLRTILAEPERFDGVQIAVASSTTHPDYANTCLEELVVDANTGTKLADMVHYREIFPGNKGRQHVPNLKQKSGVPYNEMIFWDDCTYGDNCGDVARGCPGIVCVRTPQGLSENNFEYGLEQRALGKTGVVL